MESTNVSIVLDWIERVWNRKEAGAIATYLTADTIAHGMGPNGTALVGIEAFAKAHALFCDAFPDIHITVDTIVAADDKVAAYLTCTATHKGDSLGIPASGKEVIFHAMTIARLENSKILEGWNLIDLLSVFLQAGVMNVASALP